MNSPQTLGDPYQILKWIRPGDSPGQQIDSLVRIVQWLRQPISSDYTPAESWAVRLRYLQQLLERNPVLKDAIAMTLRQWITEASWIPLLAQTALQQESALLSEFTNRVLRRWLPRPRTDWDWSDLIDAVFYRDFDSDTLREQNARAPTLSRFVYGLAIGDDTHAQTLAKTALRSTLLDALTILSAEVASVGVSADIREKLGVRHVPELPFVRLNRALAQLVFSSENSKNEKPPTNVDDTLSITLECIADCRQTIIHLHHTLQSSGVSVSLVFKLEKLETLIHRIDSLITLGWVESGSGRDLIFDALLADLIDETHRNRSLGGLIRQNFRLLARKIAERTGSHGEHYIARTGVERLTLFWSAAGGGALTALTSFLKVMIGHLKLPPFMEGIASTLNYGGSFLVMQMLHLTLATKQPSMTAASLAARLGEVKRRRQLDEITNEIIAIIRSQILAAVGNVAFVIPVAWLIDRLWFKLFHTHVLSSSYALGFLDSIHPLLSLTIPYAALTGIVLWLASVLGGWAENGVVYHRIHEVLGQRSRLIRFLGAQRVERLSQNFPATVSSWTVNLSLGAMLGFIPVLGRFSGLPLDVRHVTLTAGTATLAISALGIEGMSTPLWVSTAAGITLIGVFNFGVSFVLALQVAASARGLEQAPGHRPGQAASRWTTFRILGAVLFKVLRHPWMLIKDARGGKSTP